LFQLVILSRFPGIASVASFTLNIDTPVGASAFGSLFQIGLAFGVGITLAIILCAPISGGHFNPAVTFCYAIWRGFPWRKVPPFILSQIFGAFVAGMVLMGCYWPEIQTATALDIEKYGTAVYSGGSASILCPFPNANQTNLKYLFFQEFMVSAVVSTVIWGCIDPANPFTTPSSMPYTIGIAYATIVWGFGANTVSMNMARDLGTRIVSAIFFGVDAFTYLNYSGIANFVNIPAYIFGAAYYEYVMRDSLKLIQAGHARHENGEDGMVFHLSKIRAYDTEREVLVSPPIRI
jgi:glycerol uptake facilitator-like aquaporin